MKTQSIAGSLLKMLRRLEWSGFSHFGPPTQVNRQQLKMLLRTCPICGGLEPEGNAVLFELQNQGHLPECDLGKLLNEYKDF